MKWFTFKLLLFCLLLALSGCSGCHKNPSSPPQGSSGGIGYDPIDSWPDWSPDGSTIAYTHVPIGEPIDSIAKYGSPYQIWLLSVSSRSKRYLTAGFGSRWSPDGNKLIVYKGIALPYIIKANGDSLTSAPITGDLLAMTWLPDGRRFGFTGNPKDSQPGLWVMNTDGSNQQRTLTVSKVCEGEWDRGSFSIVFGRNPNLSDSDRFNSSEQIWLADGGGQNIRQLTGDPNRTDRYPRWSFDGSTINFESE